MGLRGTVLLLASVTAAMIVVGWGGGRAEEARAAPRPNIIFVMTDDQDKDTIRHMPFVHDTLMPNATTFPNATFNHPLCCPSRTSILRGQYTHNHGVWENTADLDGGYEKFLANGLDSSNFPIWLDQAGYNVGGFGLYVNEYDPAIHGTPAGFDYFRHYTRDWNNRQIPTTEHRDRYVKDNAVRWLKQNVNGPPLMMWVSFHAPHTPFDYDPQYRNRFTSTVMPKGAAFNEADVSDKPDYVRNLPRLTEGQIAEKEEEHRDRLRALLTPDAALSELRDTVHEAGELDNTYIVFWTDNGWMMGEHRLKSGKGLPYLESTSFPMVIRGPGVPKGATDERLVMNQDLAPTFAKLAGAATPAFVDGRSMVPILDGEGPWREVGLIEGPPPNVSYQPPAYEGLRAEDYTYVEYSTGEKEYYNLRTDPNQLENGYGALEDRRKTQLAARLDALSGCARDACREAEEATPPETSILRTGTGAVSVTNSADASFSFESDEPGSEFECSLNSASSFSSCTSPKTYSGLTTNRQHTFRVRAIDRTGQVDPTPDSHTWTIDTTHPETTLTDKPPRSSNSDSATFRFAGTDNNTVSQDLKFRCRLAEQSDSFGPCSSPQTYTDLGQGSHTFDVRAVDQAGNADPTPETYTWTIDTTHPETTLTAKPEATTAATAATFEFSSEPGATFECSLDGAVFADCSSPRTYSSLAANRQHTFRVRAEDEAGNVDPTPASYTWTIDTSRPDTRITGGPDGLTDDRTPTFAFSGSDNLAADLEFSFKVDNQAWSPFSDSTSATLRGDLALPDGPHTFFVKARDQAGNEDASPAERSFTVDTVAPAIPVIDSPRENRIVSGSFAMSGIAEAGSTVKLFEGSDVRGAATTDDSGNWSILLTGVTEGSHTYTAKATDAAGNTSETSEARTVIVDTTAPRVESAVPARGARGVDPAANVVIFFSEAMKAATVDASTFKLYRARTSTPIAAVVEYDAEKGILDPSDPLVRGKRYKAVVTTRMKDVAGNRLDQDPTRTGLQPKIWFFTVRSQ